MISLYGLFILLLTAGAIHAQAVLGHAIMLALVVWNDECRQFTTGSSLFKSAPRPYRKVTYLIKAVHLHLRILNQKKDCTGGHGIRKLSKSCPQQQSQLEPQPSTSYGPPQSDEMPLPAYVKMGIFQYYIRLRRFKQHRKFIKEEARYFKSEYLFEKKLGEGKFGAVFLATRRSDGKKVAYKSIPKTKIREYASESSPSPICHLRNPLGHSEVQSVAQCMSSRPLGLLIPYEAMMQMYLSQPGHKNPYVPNTFDYIVLKHEFVLVMEYFGENWVTLSSYSRKGYD
ncbi:hypothetical protein BASA61_001880 [Batrachochytrium salamandrivorans]|nr:hypothetical protein BASA61_001880 [Batrachochytrium salamandrivorans]